MEGIHDAIITKTEFEQAQAVIRGGVKNLQKTRTEYPLRSLVRCDNCKRVMTRLQLEIGDRFYRCTHSTQDGDSDCLKDKKFGEVELERIIYNAVAQYT